MEPKDYFEIKLFPYQHHNPENGYAFIDTWGDLEIYYQGNWRKYPRNSTVDLMLSHRPSSSIYDRDTNMDLNDLLDSLLTLVMKQWKINNISELKELVDSIKLADKLSGDVDG